MTTNRIKTLLLYAGKFPRARTRRNRLNLLEVANYHVQNVERRVRNIRNRLLGRKLYDPGFCYDALSYVRDWKDAFCASRELDVTTCDITNLAQYWNCRRAICTFPLIVILHCATGDDMSLLRKTEHWFDNRGGKLAVFIGNEYDVLDDKIGFLVATGADYVCTQLPLKTARWLYAECKQSQVIATPHALNPDVYKPDADTGEAWDIVFRGNQYGRMIGDTERDDIISFFSRLDDQRGLRTNVEVNSRVRRSEWAKLLQQSLGIIGAESGSYFLDRRAAMIESAKRYLGKHPDATFEEVFEACFQSRNVEHISGKCISSRHFEPIGTKTCQVLVEGDYNGILRADEHFLAVKKDLSNIQEVIDCFRDDGFRQKMVDSTYEYVLDEHTYAHRVRSFVNQVAA